MKNLLKNERGSVTMVAYAAVLFLSLYAVIIYANSASAYKIQSKSLLNVKRAYESGMDNIYTIYSNYSGEAITISE